LSDLMISLQTLRHARTHGGKKNEKQKEGRML